MLKESTNHRDPMGQQVLPDPVAGSETIYIGKIGVVAAQIGYADMPMCRSVLRLSPVFRFFVFFIAGLFFSVFFVFIRALACFIPPWISSQSLNVPLLSLLCREPGELHLL